MVGRCNSVFQCRGVLLIWIIVGQGPTALAGGAGESGLDIFFSHLSFLASFSLPLGVCVWGGADIDCSTVSKGR